MNDKQSSDKPLPSDTSFSEYYVMMLSVIHGLVLGGAAYGLSSLVIGSAGTHFTINLWNLLRWTTSFLFAITAAWKYIVGASYLKWELDPFDVAIPSLLGVALSATFILVNNPTGWLWMTIVYILLGVLAGVNAIVKDKKLVVIDDRKRYRKNILYSLLGFTSGVIVFVILWRVLPRTIVPGATVILFVASLLQLRAEFKLWRVLRDASKT